MRDIKIFHGLDSTVIEFLETLMIKQTYEKGQAVCLEDDVAEAMYFIEKGEVNVKVSGKTIGTLHEGESFGEMSLIDMMRRSATVEAKTEIEIYVLDKKAFYRLYKKDLESYTMIILNIARELSRRIRELDFKLSENSDGIYI